MERYFLCVAAAAEVNRRSLYSFCSKVQLLHTFVLIKAAFSPKATEAEFTFK